jgi:CheY-like chemotaxis protein
MAHLRHSSPLSREHAVPSQKITNTDDSQPYLDMIQDVLHDVGYPDVTCHTGPGAFEHIRDAQPDLALIDLNFINAGEGWILLDMLRLYPATRLIPIILCSTDPTLPITKAALLESLHCSFLEKPFDIEILIDSVAAAIGPPLQARL